MFDQEEAMLRWAGGNIDVSEVIQRLECPRCGCGVDTRGGDPGRGEPPLTVTSHGNTGPSFCNVTPHTRPQ